MTTGEYPEFFRDAVDSYTDDLVRNVRLSPEAAHERSSATVANLLSDALATPGHRILVAEDDGARIGHLWLARQATPAGEIVYLYDIAVNEEFRGHGYGRRLMELLESETSEMGLSRIELNVFGHNDHARSLYESLGYTEMSRQLFKELGAG